MPGQILHDPSDFGRPSALVIGAGIAGLTAAHELAVRGFDVVLMEAEGDGRPERMRPHFPDPIAPEDSDPTPLDIKLGGLAASQYRQLAPTDEPDQSAPDKVSPFYLPADDRPGAPRHRLHSREQTPKEAWKTAADQIEKIAEDLRDKHNKPVKQPLVVGEHGFRFFPAYYLHLFDSLRRIPISDDDGDPTYRTVYDNIVEVTSQAVSTTDNQPSLIFPRRPPTSLAEFFATTEQLREVGVRPGDIEQLFRLIARYLATSAERRTADFETISAYEYFVGLNPVTGQHSYHYSTAVEELLRNMPRVLAAFNSEWGDARTNISTFLQLQLRMSEENKADGVLNGTTTRQWFDHWARELHRLGVTFVKAQLSEFDLWVTPDDGPGTAGGRDEEVERLSLQLLIDDADLTATEIQPAVDQAIKDLAVAKNERDEAENRLKADPDNRQLELELEATKAFYEIAQKRKDRAKEYHNAIKCSGEKAGELASAAKSELAAHRAIVAAEDALREKQQRDKKQPLDEAIAELKKARAELDKAVAELAEAKENSRKAECCRQKARDHYHEATQAMVSAAIHRRNRSAADPKKAELVKPPPDADAPDYDDAMEPLLLIDRLLRRRINEAFMAVLQSDDVCRAIRRKLAATTSAQHGIVHPHHLRDARAISLIVEAMLSWLLETQVKPGSGAWLIDSESFRKLEEIVEAPETQAMAAASPREEHEAQRRLWRELETLNTTEFIVGLDHARYRYRQHLEPSLRRIERAIALHAKASKATLAAHYRPASDPSETRHPDGFATMHGFDYCVLAAPPHIAEAVTDGLRRLGVAGTVRDLDGFTTLSPPPLGPLEPSERRRRRERKQQLRCPVCMHALGTEPWDRFQTLAGIQFYFTTEFQLALGHVYYADSEWALSSINQQGLWERRPNLRQDGYVSVLSVDIGDWNRQVRIRGRRGKEELLAARDCNPDQLAHEVWRQICTSLLGELHPEVMDLDQGRGRDIQRWAERLPRPLWYTIDQNLVFAANVKKKGADRTCPHCHQSVPEKAKRGVARNRSPYLVPIVGDWFNRPGGFPWNPHGTSMIIRPTERTWRRELRDGWTWQARHGGYQVHFGRPEHEGGLVFAGTWCKTFTRMTTMEAACESGRHAVNAILDHYLWINTEEQREVEDRPIIRPPDATPIEHMTGPVRHPTAFGDYCFVFDIENREPMDFRPTRLLDRRYFFDDREHPWDLAGGRFNDRNDFTLYNPLSPAYLERMVEQLRDWRSLLEGLDNETRPHRRNDLSGRAPVSVAEDSRYPHRKLYYVPGSPRVYEFMAMPDPIYQEHLATAFADARDPSHRANAGFDRMGRPINRGWWGSF